MSVESVIVTQSRKRGSRLIYGLLEALIVVTVLMALYGFKMALETSVLVVFSALPVLLAFAVWRFSQGDVSGSVTVTSQRLIQANEQGKTVQEVKLSEVGAILTSRSNMTIFTKSNGEWVTELFHGLEHPEALGDAITGFKDSASAHQASPSKQHRIVRHALWITLGLIFVEAGTIFSWMAIDSKQFFLPVLVSALVGYLLIVVIYLSQKRANRGGSRSHADLTVTMQKGNLKIPLSKDDTLYLLTSQLQLDTKAQGKNIIIWTGIPSIDGSQGVFIPSTVSDESLQAPRLVERDSREW